MNFITRKGERKVRNSLSERAATVDVQSLLYQCYENNSDLSIYLFTTVNTNFKYQCTIQIYNNSNYIIKTNDNTHIMLSGRSIHFYTSCVCVQILLYYHYYYYNNISNYQFLILFIKMNKSPFQALISPPPCWSYPVQ